MPVFMKKTKFARLASCILVCCGLSLGFGAAAEPASTPMPPPQYHGSLVVVTGGIGSDEVAAFRRVRQNYALSLNYSVTRQNDNKAAFVSDVQVVIRDQYDQTLLNITTDGPFCLVQLPAGNYTVHSTYLGQTQSHQVSISDNKPTALDIQWTVTATES